MFSDRLQKICFRNSRGFNRPGLLQRGGSQFAINFVLLMFMGAVSNCDALSCFFSENSLVSVVSVPESNIICSSSLAPLDISLSGTWLAIRFPSKPEKWRCCCTVLSTGEMPPPKNSFVLFGHNGKTLFLACTTCSCRQKGVRLDRDDVKETDDHEEKGATYAKLVSKDCCKSWTVGVDMAASFA